MESSFLITPLHRELLKSIPNDLNKDQLHDLRLLLEDYFNGDATAHELSSRKNKQRLESAIEKLNRGEGFQRDLLEE